SSPHHWIQQPDQRSRLAANSPDLGTTSSTAWPRLERPSQSTYTSASPARWPPQSSAASSGAPDIAIATKADELVSYGRRQVAYRTRIPTP
ncbi:hypothetical protein N9247_00795, partial [bacterium]|nr:hypothetical protein [bacterium]